MKIPLLILCLAVVYSTCRTYDEEDHVIKAIQSNGDYKNYANMPFERSLARYKRTILSPVPALINTLLWGLNNVRSTDKNFMTFISDLLTRKNDLNQIKKIIQDSFEIITEPVNALIDQIFQIAIYLFLNIFLPALHTVLFKLMNTGLLPSQIEALIIGFDMIYKCLQFTGYVPY
ncbi:hypothetical protein ALC56_10880 [Trachymyrmex septentrionalis]|uniref:Uncharacterized protein n=1 Tax=Trachymyrmex septentrionalis TaxID=34720 RepID=A0A195F416_9HYME|nr:PREDICTED: uncharacterized protein LOC108752262 [Trachymyrmex septentrionalis]KYN34912.1 hypothetical protein ALC56_10880 [Trachymyrmex septentrionalis]